tara:strand:- start:14995 stop:15462 length:468 start_codon:yes stop_codon:yes gene_type:complete
MIMSTKPRRHYELRVIPPELTGKRAGYGLALFQSRVRANQHDDEPDMERVVQVWGDPLRSVMEPVLTAVKRAGYRATDIGPKRRAPFQISEEDAVRLGLLFQAVKPLRKTSRIESISEHVRAMEHEEVLYWFSKTASQDSARRAQRALRILMAEE